MLFPALICIEWCAFQVLPFQDAVQWITYSPGSVAAGMETKNCSRVTESSRTASKLFFARPSIVHPAGTSSSRPPRTNPGAALAMSIRTLIRFAPLAADEAGAVDIDSANGSTTEKLVVAVAAIPPSSSAVAVI